MRSFSLKRVISITMLACASSLKPMPHRVAPHRPQSSPNVAPSSLARTQSSPDVAPSSLARKHLLSAGVALLAAAPLASRAKDFGCTEGEDDYFCLDGKLRAQNGLPAYQAPPKAKVDGAAAKERRLEAMRAQYRGARAGAAPAPAPPPGAAPPPA